MLFSYFHILFLSFFLNNFLPFFFTDIYVHRVLFSYFQILREYLHSREADAGGGGGGDPHEVWGASGLKWISVGVPLSQKSPFLAPLLPPGTCPTPSRAR
jgi:hypothetical protein